MDLFLGLYNIQYSEEIMDDLKRNLPSKGLSSPHRAQLQWDAFWSAGKNISLYSSALNLTNYMKYEYNLNTWITTQKIYEELRQLLLISDFYHEFEVINNFY